MSNLLQAKANDKSPTIAIPGITVLRQSRPSLGEFQAAVMNEWPLGTGEHPPIGDPPGETALRSPCLAGSFEGIATVKPPLVKEITVRLPKCKSPEAQGALEPTQDDQKDDIMTKKIEDELKSSKCPQPVANACCDEGRLDDRGTPNETRNLTTTVTGSKGPVEGNHLVNGEKLKAINHLAVSAQPVTPLRGDAFEERTSRSMTDQKATGQEAASAQAVYRGHKVEMSEVVDQDDDTSFMMNMKSKLMSPIDIETAVTLPTVVEPSWVNAMAKEAPQLLCIYTSGETYSEWLKPFGAEWTLHGIVEAKTESEAKAILKNWIHKARAEEVMDSMIEGMWKAMQVDVLWWLEELWQPKHYISAISGKGKDLTINVQIGSQETTPRLRQLH